MTDETRMSPLRPYLVRALLDWINSNQMRPHVLVDATVPGVVVPQQAIVDGRVVLNLAATAVSGLVLDNDELRFSTRFGGTDMQVVLPMKSLVALYAHETGVGMHLPPDAEVERTATPEATPPVPAKDKRAHLRVVK